MEKKELKDISWLVDEPTYRADPALSYSNLSTYQTLGFTGLEHLFDRKESLSLTLGSATDAIITGGIEEFNEHFAVVDIPSMGDKEGKIVKHLFNLYSSSYSSIEEVPATYILAAANEFNYGADNWKPDTKINKISTAGSPYWRAKISVGDKTILTPQNFQDVQNMVRALRESPATCMYFANDDEWSSIRRYYQLKFKFKVDEVEYRSMMDLVIVDYAEKKIYPIDLKTSLSTAEWDFEQNFKKWHYYVQARLYWRNLRANMDRDDYFKDFSLEDYRFIIVNPRTLTPLVWEFPLTKSVGQLVTDAGEIIEDPFTIGKELRGYLDCKPPVPVGINQEGVNMITCIHPKEEALTV